MSVTQTEPGTEPGPTGAAAGIDSPAVPVRFQQFLNQQGCDCGPEDGRAGPKMERAVRAFQKRHKLPPTGRIDPDTERKVLALDPRLTAHFEIGPDKTGDIRQHRPYFAVQLERDDRPVPYVRTGEPRPRRALGDLRRPEDQRAERGIDSMTPGRQADRLCDRILYYASIAKDQPGQLLLTEEQIIDPDAFQKYLREGWLQAGADGALPDRPGVLLLRRLTDTSVVHALEHNPDDPAALIVQALNGAIEHPQLFFDTDAWTPDAGLAGRIARQIEQHPAVRMGVATVLAEPQNRDFPKRLEEQRASDAAALAGDLLEYLSGPDAAHLASRLHVFVNRLLVGIAFEGYLRPIEARGPVTDVFLLSHGWHRNYYQATSAYDRLVSRFSRLLDRQILPPPKPFHPLILGAHWHSDPGEDGWVDPAGRRDKRSFLQNIELLFERPSAADEADVDHEERFTRVFEECFEFFGHMSAADVHALSDRTLDAKAEALAAKLDPFTLRDGAAALEHNKVAAAWTCYHESQPKKVLTDQEMPPARGLTPVEAVNNLVRFALGAAGIGVVLGLLINSKLAAAVKGHALGGLGRLHGWLSAAWMPPPETAHLHPLLGAALVALWSGLVWLVVGLGLLALAAGVGALFLAWRARPAAPKRLRGVSYWVVAAWVPVEILLFLPALIVLLFTYFFSRRNEANPQGIFSERIGARDAPITEAQRDAALEGLGTPRLGRAPARRWAAWLSTRPIALYKQTLHPKNPQRDLFAGFENMLAFYEMQVRGTIAGGTAGQFLFRIVTDMADLGLCRPGVRVHLVGHSFGGLVVLNAARHAALDPRCRRPGEGNKPAVKIHSLTLLQAAVGSNWAEGEKAVLENMTGTLGCAYSAYDTANGFYYPVANGGRLAAGYVGFFGTPGPDGPRPAPRIPRLKGNDFKTFDTEDADRGLLAMLAEPPPLGAIVKKLKDGDGQVLNLDMSRIVYEGPVPLGGGHTDIYKDDTINLVWAVSRLGKAAGDAAPDSAPLTATAPVAESSGSAPGSRA